MKTSTALTLLTWALAGTAQAQSSVTIYGVLDVAAVYQTNTTPSGAAMKTLQQGGEGFQAGSRLGFKGSEDLGGGMRAGFVLEEGLLADTGTLDQQGQAFGRQAYVFLGTPYGDLSAGRLYTPGNWMVYGVEPLGIGATGTNGWMIYMTGQRFNNAVSYGITRGPLSVMAEYAFGETVGSTRAMSSSGLGLKYATPAMTLIGVLQQSNDNLQRKARIANVGGKWQLGSFDLYADYMRSDRDAGFDSSKGGTDTASITGMATAATATNKAAISSVFSVARRDNFYFVGAGYALTPQLRLLGNAIHVNTTASGFDGTRTTLYAVLDYAFSKRTGVYVAAARDTVGGSWAGLLGNATTNYTGGSGAVLNGHNEQSTAYVGMRHAF